MILNIYNLTRHDARRPDEIIQFYRSVTPCHFFKEDNPMSRVRKALCLLLSFVFFFQLLPVTALAADEDASRTNEGPRPAELSDAVAADEIAVLGEDTSLREEFTKQYTLENGAKMAVVYPNAVHYEENGEL